MKDNIGATEQELIQALDNDKEEDEAKDKKDKEEDDSNNLRKSVTKSLKKSMKKKLNKEEMKAKLQQKEEGFDKWRDLSNIRGQKLQNLEPSYKGKNKFGVIKTDLIPEDLKKTVDDIRQKAEEHGLPSVIEE